MSVCACPDGNGWDTDCKLNECPDDGEQHPLFAFINPWKPLEASSAVVGCEQWNGVFPGDQWTPQADIDPSFNDYTQAGQCKHRRMGYHHADPANFRLVRWDWTAHGTPLGLSLNETSVVGRVAYPPPIIEMHGEFESSLIGFASPSEPLNPNAGLLRYPRTFSNVVDFPEHLCSPGGISLVLMEQPVVWLLDAGPLDPLRSGWVYRGDWAYGDAALFGLARDGGAPVSASKVVAASTGGSLPRLDRAAALVAAQLDLGLVGQQPGEGSVIFSLIPSDVSSEGGSGQDLWLGVISGTESAWKRHEAGPDSVELPPLPSPRLVVDAGVGRLLLIAGGQSGVTQGAPAHAAYALDLASGTWTAVGSLALPPWLTGHSVVHDPFTRSLYVMGGEVGSEPSGAVYRVELADLRVTQLDVELPLAARRAGAAASLAPDRRTIYLWGGQHPDGSHPTDLWRFDRARSRFEQIATGISGARQDFVSTDSTGRQILLGGVPEHSTDGSIRLVSVDASTGVSQPRVALDLTPPVPGLLSGKVRDGLAQVFPLDIPSGTLYPGEVRLVTLQAEAAGLTLRVLDSRGQLMGEGGSEQAVQRVAWLGQPGERYLIHVGPGATLPSGTAVGFELHVELGVVQETARYQGAWDVTSMALKGETAVLAGPNGIQTVDLSDATQPVFLDRKHVPGHVQAVGLVGDMACIARTLQPRGLRCLDFTDPADLHYYGPGAPTLGMGRHLAVQGDFGYVTEGLHGVGIYYLADPGPPQVPRLLDHLWTGGLVIHVAVRGSRLYVAHLSGAVDVFRLAVSGTPELLGTIWADGPVAGIMAHGDTVHLQRVDTSQLLGCLLGLGCPRGDKVEVFDVGDPALATQSGEYDAAGLHWTAAVSQGDRFLVPGDDGFRVLRVTGAEGGL